MEDPYWIICDAIIFKPKFNSCLDKYTHIMSDCRILIFSNYNDPHTALKNNNLRFSNLCFESLFNQPLNNSLLDLINLRELTFSVNFNQLLSNSLSTLINLRELTFGAKFNQLLDDSLSTLINLRKLTFGYYFNRLLGDSLSTLINLEELTFSYNFNRPLGDSLSNLTNLKKLTLGYKFNQVIDIPGWITKLVLSCNLQSIIDYLPNSVVELELGFCFDLELNNLPSSIKKIIIRNQLYNKNLNNLPTGIELLVISKYYKIPIDAKYKNLNIVKF